MHIPFCHLAHKHRWILLGILVRPLLRTSINLVVIHSSLTKALTCPLQFIPLNLIFTQKSNVSSYFPHFGGDKILRYE